MNGEETGAEGRAYGFVATGASKVTAYELPKLGKFSWENSVANPFSGDNTIVVGTDDSTPGQVYIYKGTKTNTGNEVDRAGLTNGNLYGVKVAGVATETAALNGNFTLEQINTNQTGALQNTESNTLGVTQFARPEDGAWADADTFYFATTGSAAGGSAKLYRLDLDGSASSGTITMALDSASLIGTDGAIGRSFDNLTVDANGKLIIQEDPGNQAYIAKTWQFDPATSQTVQTLESDRSRFITGAPGFLTQDEESSGIIDITSILGKNDGKQYYVGNMQAHYSLGGELVEGGQVYLLAALPEPETYAMLIAGLGLFGAVARRRKQK
jgi:secreted PhoX family phosphatase